MHNKLEIHNLHIIMYLSGKKEQMLRKVISQFLDTPVPSPGLFSILLPANGKVRLASATAASAPFSRFGSVLFGSGSSAVCRLLSTFCCDLLRSTAFYGVLQRSAAFYPVLLIIAQITYRDTFFSKKNRIFWLPLVDTISN